MARHESRRLRRGGLCLAAAFPSFALTLYTAATLAKYSPLYVPLRCVSFTPKFGEKEYVVDDNWEGVVKTNGRAETWCENDNAYDIAIRGGPDDGTVSVSPQGYKLGTVRLLDGIVPAKGETTMVSNISLSFDLDIANDLKTSAGGHVISEVPSTAFVSLTFFGTRMTTAIKRTAVCGYAFEIRGDETVRGPVTCGPTLEQLDFPSVYCKEQFPYTVDADSAVISVSEFELHLALGTVLVTSALASLLLFYCGVSSILQGLLARHRRRKRSSPRLGRDEFDSEDDSSENAWSPKAERSHLME